MTARTIRAIGVLPASLRDRLEVVAVVGSAAPDPVGSDGAAAVLGPRLRIERDVRRMIDRLTWADLTVTSGGTTVWELARVGGAGLMVETAPPEHLLAQGLERTGLFDCLGPASDLDDATLGAAIARRLDDVAWRTAMARLGPSLVDGLGAMRVVDALRRLGAR
jgi:spore coat polysaccharide biosynthesis predicted glycosyltransferase SpsG